MKIVVQYGSDKRVGFRDHVNEKIERKKKREKEREEQGFGFRALGHQGGGTTTLDFITLFNN